VEVVEVLDHNVQQLYQQEVLVVVEEQTKLIVAQQEIHLLQLQHKEHLEELVDQRMEAVAVVALQILELMLLEDLVAVVEMEHLQKLLVQQL
tara:strand:+ start:74 stop:349 length:276 start_codon:yes stop_codon:yes gene_type:complete